MKSKTRAVDECTTAHRPEHPGLSRYRARRAARLAGRLHPLRSIGGLSTPHAGDQACAGCQDTPSGACSRSTTRGAAETFVGFVGGP